MKRNFLFLLFLIALYVLSSVVLHMVYGESYPLWPGGDYWRPDGEYGWEAVGTPAEPMPTMPSRNVPTPLMFLPFLLPGLILAAVLLTPLSRILEDPPQPAEVEEEDDEPGEDERV